MPNNPDISPLAGRPAARELLIDSARLERDYHERRPDCADPNQLVSFGASGAPFGGLKIVSETGWFAARPSGTEHIYKVYAESFKDQEHPDQIVSAVPDIVSNALRSPHTSSHLVPA